MVDAVIIEALQELEALFGSKKINLLDAGIRGAAITPSRRW